MKKLPDPLQALPLCLASQKTPSFWLAHVQKWGCVQAHASPPAFTIAKCGKQPSGCRSEHHRKKKQALFGPREWIQAC